MYTRIICIYVGAQSVGTTGSPTGVKHRSLHFCLSTHFAPSPAPTLNFQPYFPRSLLTQSAVSPSLCAPLSPPPSPSLRHFFLLHISFASVLIPPAPAPFFLSSISLFIFQFPHCSTWRLTRAHSGCYGYIHGFRNRAAASVRRMERVEGRLMDTHGYSIFSIFHPPLLPDGGKNSSPTLLSRCRVGLSMCLPSLPAVLALLHHHPPLRPPFATLFFPTFPLLCSRFHQSL